MRKPAISKLRHFVYGGQALPRSLRHHHKFPLCFSSNGASSTSTTTTISIHHHSSIITQQHYNFRLYHYSSFNNNNNHSYNHEHIHEIDSTIQNLKSRISIISHRIHLPLLKQELQVIQSKINMEDFWDDTKGAQLTIKRQSFLQNQIQFLESALLQLQNHQELLLMLQQEEEELEENKQILNELRVQLRKMSHSLDEKDLETLFCEREDNFNCFIEIYAGAGGMDTNDWAESVMNMYVNWCSNNGLVAKVQDVTSAKQVGIKHALLSVSGQRAYGWLKNEHGVHRFVRCSPYDNNKRHTSFVGVNVYPEVDDSIGTVEVNPKDLKIETMRASGAGGQHVNKTDSAVRITHEPTGIVVSCQENREQHQNKKKALKTLESKLYALELNKRQQIKKDRLDSLDDVAFGSQIRSYVFHPYKLVKDLRTNSECSNPDSFLAGDGDYLREFMMQLLEANQSKEET